MTDDVLKKRKFDELTTADSLTPKDSSSHALPPSESSQHVIVVCSIVLFVLLIFFFFFSVGELLGGSKYLGQQGHRNCCSSG